MRHAGYRRRRGAARGQSLVELAILLPLLALLLIGTLDLGRAFYAAVQLTNGVREGAAFGRLYHTAVDSGARADPHNIPFRVRDESDLLIDPGDIDVRCFRGTAISTTNVIACSGAASGDYIEVTARYRFRPITSQLIRLLPNNYAIRKSLRMVIQ